ncbi:MAG: aminopeptidase P family protein [Gammaproteobacteria bacterium]|nr:aminopeptidase P family protein [Gammaproteobacteria bacterium]
MDRRDLISGAALAGAVGALYGCGGAATSGGKSPDRTHADLAPPLPPRPAAEILRDAPPMNLERAREVMAAEDLAGLIVSNPVNVYHMTGHWPASARMGPHFRLSALLSRDADQPIALVSPEFTYYYLLADNAYRYPQAIYLFTGPADADAFASASEQGYTGQPAAAASRMFVDRGVEPVSERERARQAAVHSAMATTPASASREFALLRAARDLGLDRGRVGTDDPQVTALFSSAGLAATLTSADDTLKRIRLIKSPREIALMRLASEANVAAADAAMSLAREGATLRELRTSFFSEAARRGNRGVFMVLDGMAGEGVDATLRDGQAFLFDAVSEGAGYHGDYARTVFVGEPARTMREVTRGIETGWTAVREALRPGLRLSEIPEIGRAAMRKAGHDFNVIFQPHSVGLYHGDAFGLGDHPLQEHMVLSVDCPIMETGVGGSAHLEDLMLITRDGAEPIHEVTPSVIVV